jgi:hypothetical protein
MILCLAIDLFVWTLAIFIIYSVIRRCRKSSKENEDEVSSDNYDLLSSDSESESLSSTDSVLTSVMVDEKLQNMTTGKIRTFHLPQFVLNRFYPIPHVSKAELV